MKKVDLGWDGCKGKYERELNTGGGCMRGEEKF